MSKNKKPHLLVRELEKELPVYLSSSTKKQILNAVKNGTPILICGLQGPTGKTHLKDLLTSKGVVAVEEWEAQRITLDRFIGPKSF